MDNMTIDLLNGSSIEQLYSRVLELCNNDSQLQLLNNTEDICNHKKSDQGTYNFFQMEQLYFLWALFALIVIGNCLVLNKMLFTKNRKTRMNFFIMHLAIADLLVGLSYVFADIVWRITIGFYGGTIVCKLVRYLQVTVTFSSTYLLVAMSIDRYDAITHPMNFSSSRERSKLLVGLAWLLSGIFAIAPTVLYQWKMVNGYPQCWIDMGINEWRIYIMMIAFSLFFVPTIIISACYGIIVFTIWKKSKNVAPPPTLPNSVFETTSMNPTYLESNKKKRSHQQNSDREMKRASSRGVIPRAKIKSVQMTFVIVIVFVLCWSPYFFYGLLQVFGYIPRTPNNNAVSSFVQSLAPLNSAANPIIYFLFSTNIFKKFYIDSIIENCQKKKY